MRVASTAPGESNASRALRGETASSATEIRGHVANFPGAVRSRSGLRFPLHKLLNLTARWTTEVAGQEEVRASQQLVRLNLNRQGLALTRGAPHGKCAAPLVTGECQSLLQAAAAFTSESWKGSWSVGRPSHLVWFHAASFDPRRLGRKGNVDHDPETAGDQDQEAIKTDAMSYGPHLRRGEVKTR